MTPRETTITVRSGLWVTVDEWEASAKVTVRYKGKLLAAPRRIRLRDGKEGAPRALQGSGADAGQLAHQRRRP